MTTNFSCGIYTIHCIANDRIYIGSSNDIARRFIQHKFDLSNGCHHNPDLQADWLKYGSKNFTFRAAEECAWWELRWRELVNIFDTYSFFELYNVPSIKDRIVYGIGKYLYDDCYDFVVDKKIMIDDRWYNFNLSIACRVDTYISLRNDDFDFVKGAEAYRIKAEHVDNLNGRFTEFCYNSELTDDDIQKIIDDAICFVEGVSE